MRLALLLACAVAMVSCVDMRRGDMLRLEGRETRLDVFREGMITASYDGGTMDDVVELLPDGVSVCMSESLRFRRMSLDVDGVDVDTFLLAVTKSLGCSLEVYGRLYCFIDGKQSGDSGVVPSVGGAKDGTQNAGACMMYATVPWYKSEEVVSACGGCGCSAQYINGDNYIVRGDLGGLVKARQMLDAMLSSLPCEYAFELVMVTRDYLLDVDLGLSVGGSMQLDWSRVSGGLADWQWRLIGALVSDAKLERSSSDNVRHVSGVFRENSRYVTTVGDEIPYVKRSVLESGSAVDSGVEYIQIGFSLDIGCKGGAAGICDMRLDVQDVGGYVRDYPVKHGSTLQTEFVIGGDDRRFVGSFISDGWNKSLLGRKRQKAEWLVFVRVLRVSVGQKVQLVGSKNE